MKNRNLLLVLAAFGLLSLFTISPEAIAQSETKQTLTAEVTEGKPWYSNSYYGISVETPFKLDKQNVGIPEGYEAYIKTLKSYVGKNDEMIINLLYMDTNFEGYDVKAGLRGAINNMVFTMEGSDLKLNYIPVEGKPHTLKCTGTFMYQNTKIKIYGYAYWDEKGKIAMVQCFGEDSAELKFKMQKVIASIRTVF